MTVRNHIRTLQHRLIETGLSTGVLDGTPRMEIGPASARFVADDWREWYRARNGMGESTQLKWFLDRLREDDIVWDVGAAVGTYACLSADIGSEVVAIEPHPAAAGRLRENVNLNNQSESVTVQEVALGARDSRAQLQSTGSASNGSHHLGDGEIKAVVRRGESLACPAPDVVKIDVEGHEQAALDGLSDRLAGARVVLVEVHPDTDRGAIRGQLSGAGFDIEAVGERGSELHLGGVAANWHETEGER